jgi:hypothetical protein
MFTFLEIVHAGTVKNAARRIGEIDKQGFFVCAIQMH